MNLTDEWCSTCPAYGLSLMSENQEAWRLWQLLAGQQNTNGRRCGPLWFPSIQFIFDLYEVENRREAFEKINLIHSIYMDKVPS